MTTTRDRLKEAIEQILLTACGNIIGQIECIDEKALALINDEQRLYLHETILEAAERCANFAATYYCDAGDVLTVRGSIDKVTFQPGKGVTVTVSALNTPDNIISLAEMGSGVSIHGLQTVIPNTVAPKVAGEAGGQMDLGEALTEGEAPEGDETQGEEAEGETQDLGTAEFNEDGTPRKLPDWWKNDGAPAADATPGDDCDSMAEAETPEAEVVEAEAPAARRGRKRGAA
ncbi:MAG: hypothetical protein IT364_24645 [Candidatus Hydrogenedentes bacterium]|nr:hypothetical protein [Candidatus Hydrogenedentota bacterium]